MRDPLAALLAGDKAVRERKVSILVALSVLGVNGKLVDLREFSCHRSILS